MFTYCPLLHTSHLAEVLVFSQVDVALSFSLALEFIIFPSLHININSSSSTFEAIIIYVHHFYFTESDDESEEESDEDMGYSDEEDESDSDDGGVDDTACPDSKR